MGLPTRVGSKLSLMATYGIGKLASMGLPTRVGSKYTTRLRWAGVGDRLQWGCQPESAVRSTYERLVRPTLSASMGLPTRVGSKTWRTTAARLLATRFNGAANQSRQ